MSRSSLELNPASLMSLCPSGGRARGFTLLEVAIVLAVIGLVAAISIGSFAGAFGSRDARTAAAAGQDINGALMTYARTNHHLPCPDTDGDGRSDDAGGCPAGVEMGYVPYETLGLTSPATAARAVYGVYRNASIGADLVAPIGAGLATRSDFERALAVAAAVTPVSADHVFITGDGAATGSVDCANNRVLAPAYAVVVPATDHDGDGSALDGVDAALPGGGHCLASPNSAPTADFDDHVVFTGSTTLLGLISGDAP
ncbi:MAG TPA: type II secretion system protein [Rhodanobacteraceae bacterium]|nr:type II secretion system protein [Rhodanobacteraceae bacterium]